MLQRLYIKNFAIISELSIDWEDNLSIITGETGAGKSILLGALGLILGKRADHSVILDKKDKCVIEAQFAVSKSSSINEQLSKREFEVYDDLIIRREISPSGRSRAFINDTPAKLEDVASISRQLVDLHRQFDNYELLQRSEQISIIDSYLLLNEERSNFKKTFSELQSVQKKLAQKKEEARKTTAEQDYTQYIFDEIEELALKGTEIESWESKLNLLSNAQEIQETLLGAANELLNGDEAIIDKLQVISKSIKQFSDTLPEIGNISERLIACLEELKDVAAELEIQESNISSDEEELQLLTEKLGQANKLLLKHSLSSTAELITLRESLSEKLFNISSNETEIVELEKIVAITMAKSVDEAEQLSKKRIAGIKKFSKSLNEMLPDLGFVNASFDIQHSFKEMSANGIDDIQFRFDANNTGQMQSLQKAVSGGEMSRIMLIIKYLLAHTTEMPCMIFDEIDTGISGETALRVGGVLKKLAQNHQVISITHLPQIAAQAEQHLFVYKESASKGEARNTKVKKLAQDERVKVIAEMLSGNQQSATATKTAEELLGMN